jgi:hypothetical protein
MLTLYDPRPPQRIALWRRVLAWAALLFILLYICGFFFSLGYLAYILAR